MSESTCLNCRFSCVIDKSHRVCRRNPPVIFDYSSSRFPAVEDENWCGEWALVSSKAPVSQMEHTEERPTGLLACPFCGSHNLELSTGERFWLYECGSCECEGPPAASIATAIELWNARAEVKK